MLLRRPDGRGSLGGHYAAVCSRQGAFGVGILYIASRWAAGVFQWVL